MRRLTSQELVAVWEEGQDQHPLDRALTLLEPVCPDLTRGELAALPLGARNALLLELRTRTIGETLRAVADCPACPERLEFTLRAHDLRIPPGPPPGERGFTLTDGDLELRFRLPATQDLAAVLRCGDAAAGRRLLAARCVLEVRREGEPVALEALTEQTIGRLAARMAACDPQAELLLELRCPGCGHGWQADFDLAGFLWGEVAVEARRLLEEVHLLARAYGWHEADILAMSQRRRQFYRERVGG